MPARARSVSVGCASRYGATVTASRNTQPPGSEIVDERGAYNDRVTLLALPVLHPPLWSAETPALYRATVALLSPEGEVIEVEAYDVGFRQVEISGGLLKLNGKPLLIRGVNRHEHHPRTRPGDGRGDDASRHPD